MMNNNNLKAQWKYEENFAFQGWDFSHIDGRWKSETLPWNYQEIVLSFLKSTDRLLDMGTGGGECLLSFKHPFALTSVTEAYPPNLEICMKELAPLGITVVQAYENDMLSFENDSFDIVLNRHESFDSAEVARVLKKGGYFITQQVGGKNDFDLSQRLCMNFAPQFPRHTLKNNTDAVRLSGFEIEKEEEAFTPVRFFDVGALVYFAKIIEWEFSDFSVDNSFDSLLRCQKEIEEIGFVQGTEHRFIIVARKI